MACFGKTCFVKQQNNIFISRDSKKITCHREGQRAIEETENRKGYIGPWRAVEGQRP
jgi:hypothetical protein